MNLPLNTIRVTLTPVPRLLFKQRIDLGSRTSLAKPDKEQYKSKGCHMTLGGGEVGGSRPVPFQDPLGYQSPGFLHLF